MSEIRINYDQTYASAKKIKALANSCAELAGKCQTTIQSIPESMEGDTADALSEALQAWEADMKLIQAGLNEVSQKIIRVADSMKVAEKRVSNDAKRGGGGFR